MTTQPDQMLPCPFCGGRAAYEECEGKIAKDIRWSIGCQKDTEGTCHGYQSLNTYLTKGDAARAWNTRSTPTPDHAALMEALKRSQWALTKAAACMLKPDNGITDTVWLSGGTTLYDHLCCEIDGIENIVTGNVEHDIEALEKHADTVRSAGG